MVTEAVLGPGTSTHTGLEPALAFEAVLRPDLDFETLVTVLGSLVVFETGL